MCLPDRTGLTMAETTLALYGQCRCNSAPPPHPTPTPQTHTHTIHETLIRLSPLPTLMHNHSDGDSVVLGVVSHFPHLLGSQSPPGPLRRELGVKPCSLTANERRVPPGLLSATESGSALATDLRHQQAPVMLLDRLHQHSADEGERQGSTGG